MNSREFAQFIQATGGETKPWLLAQLRIKKLQERRAELTAEEYLQAIADIHNDVMNLGEWWVGQEDEVF